jgi:hypothetical protein
MSNVSLPTPVALAGGALCVLGGYLIGAVLGPDTSDRTTAEVVSYEPDTDELCLTGDAVADAPGADEGVLCATWQRTSGSTPEQGDVFRFVTMTSEGGEADETVTFIYGDVVR